MQKKVGPDAYWLDTSSNDLISAIVRDLPHDMVRTLEALLRDETPRVQMAKELGPGGRPHCPDCGAESACDR